MLAKKQGRLRRPRSWKPIYWGFFLLPTASPRIHIHSRRPAFSINYMGKRSAPLAAFPTLSSNHSSSSLQSNCPSSTMDKQQQPEPRFTPFPAPQRFIACDDPDQYKCGFVTHVQSATLLIGSLGSLAAAGVMASLIKANAEPDQCVLAALILISYALLVLGWISRMPSFYWVFLIINPLVMCLCAVFCTYPALDSLLAPIVYPAERIDFMRLRPKQQLLFNVTHSLRVMELISSLSAIFLLGYFQSVVFRAHNWQRKKNRLDEQLVVIVGDQTP